jgi:EthD domain
MTASLPGPWVDHEAIVAEPWSSQAGIVKFIEFPVRRPDMSRRAFHLYWQRHHSPHVMNATGFAQFMRKYLTAHVYMRELVDLSDRFPTDPRLEGVGEVWLNSLEDATAWLSHPLYGELIAPDEANFIDASGGVAVLVTKEERLHDDDPDLVETGLTKLYVTARRNPRLGRDEFHRAISEVGRTVVKSSRGLLRRFVISHRLPDPYPDWLPPSEMDAVFELWFESRETLQRFLSAREIFPAGETGLFDASGLMGIVTRLQVVHDEFSFQPTVMQPGVFRWSD